MRCEYQTRLYDRDAAEAEKGARPSRSAKKLGDVNQRENLTVEGGMKMKYRVHRFDIKMTSDQSKLEQFLNNLEGEVVAIIPNVTWAPKTQVDFLLIVEKLG
jgi:hypothetical protein